MSGKLWLEQIVLAETTVMSIPFNRPGRIGTDVVEVERVRRLRRAHGARFERLAFTPEEIAYCSAKRDPDIHFAGRLAAKEAVYKALGLRWDGGSFWHKIEIRARENGEPYVCGPLIRDPGIRGVRVTISHTPHVALAVAWLPGNRIQPGTEEDLWEAHVIEQTTLHRRDNGQRPMRQRAPETRARPETLLEAFLRHTHTVWRYRVLVITLTAIGAFIGIGLGLAGLFLPLEYNPLPNHYEANAMLIQQRGGLQDVASAMMTSLGIEASSGSVDYGQVALEVLRSRTIMDPVIEHNNIISRYRITENPMSNARKAFLADASFAYDARTGILRITYESTDAQYAAQIVTSVVDELLAWFSTRGGFELGMAVQTLNDKLLEVEAQVGELEGEIEEFQRTYGVLRVEELADTQSSLLADFQAQLLQLDLQISNLQEVSRFQNDPELVALQEQRSNVTELMSRVRDGYTGNDRVLPPRRELPALATTYARLQTDLEIQRRIYVALTEQYEVARLTAGATPVFTILEAPEVPKEKSRPSRSRIAVATTAGGFFLAVLLALTIHGIRSAVRVTHDPAGNKE